MASKTTPKAVAIPAGLELKMGRTWYRVQRNGKTVAYLKEGQNQRLEVPSGKGKFQVFTGKRISTELNRLAKPMVAKAKPKTLAEPLS